MELSQIQNVGIGVLTIDMYRMYGFWIVLCHIVSYNKRRKQNGENKND